MTFTGYRSKSSIGISLLKVKDCFQDNCCKDKTYFSYRQIFSHVFFALYQVCGNTNAIFNYRSHKGTQKGWLQIQENGYGNKKSRNFHKLLPRLSKRLRGGYYLPI